MRAIVQRVMQASVSVGDELVSSIGRGVCVLIGISRDDTPADMEYIVRKLLNLRIFDDDNGKRWSKNVMDKDYDFLCVSQFTLYHIMKGNKPDFHCAMGGDESQRFYEQFLEKMRHGYKADKIKDGLFGAHMQVAIVNDGPVTLTLESPPQASQPSKPRKGQKQDDTKKSRLQDNSVSSSVDELAKNMESQLHT